MNTETPVKPLDNRRQLFKNEILESVEKVLKPVIPEINEDTQKIYDFCANMAISEIFRSMAYWENELLNSVKIKENENPEI